MGENKQCRKDIDEKTDLSTDKGRVTLNAICDASDLFSDSTIFFFQNYRIAAMMTWSHRARFGICILR